MDAPEDLSSLKEDPMKASHTLNPIGQTALVADRLTLISSARAGLAEQLVGRVDGHLAAFVEHMREGLVAASTAVGLEVKAPS